ncbi:macrophage infectivity potentiator Mip [Desulfuromonas carbonis]|uniref:FKBP-type peptidyl-prolyl cis-trans isomerase N-terminal domain-containing protein n=1 Tax=Desulfuromonas sp. DDH964 TaxID=1823759 RepID=UPI00078DDE1B|nr:FKBP-type peptidyl-prolyl cis-trans isomerase [Desulfuromonas sp. DDH964]AMV73259.1 peptidylprolyl cis-trans isomerase lipoprotein, FKBP-type [Desulfuromonas sp. DDH964]
MKVAIFTGGLLMFLVPLALAAEPATQPDEMDRINYSLGYQIGGDLKQQQVDIREQMLLQGMRDAMQGEPTLLTQDEMKQVLVALKKKVLKQQGVQREQTLREGRDFLVANAKREGVVALPSGLQYQVLVPGQGKQPGPDDRVRVEYRGMRLDGQEFDRSAEGAPVEFSLSQVIPGWREALPLMAEGAKWKLFVPPDLAFGERGPLADQTVIFEVKLVKVLGQTAKP